MKRLRQEIPWCFAHARGPRRAKTLRAAPRSGDEKAVDPPVPERGLSSGAAEQERVEGGPPGLASGAWGAARAGGAGFGRTRIAARCRDSLSRRELHSAAGRASAPASVRPGRVTRQQVAEEGKNAPCLEVARRSDRWMSSSSARTTKSSIAGARGDLTWESASRRDHPGLISFSSPVMRGSRSEGPLGGFQIEKEAWRNPPRIQGNPEHRPWRRTASVAQFHLGHPPRILGPAAGIRDRRRGPPAIAVFGRQRRGPAEPENATGSQQSSRGQSSDMGGERGRSMGRIRGGGPPEAAGFRALIAALLRHCCTRSPQHGRDSDHGASDLGRGASRRCRSVTRAEGTRDSGAAGQLLARSGRHHGMRNRGKRPMSGGKSRVCTARMQKHGRMRHCSFA